MQTFAIAVVVIATGLHLALHIPLMPAIIAGIVIPGVAWLVWKAKWVILAIFGLETLFGGNKDDDA